MPHTRYARHNTAQPAPIKICCVLRKSISADEQTALVAITKFKNEGQNMQRKPDSVEWILGGIIVVAVLFVWYSSNSSKNSVAIIRMDDIAKETGWDVQMGDIFRKERAAIESDIMRQQQLLKSDIDAKREEFGANPTPEQVEILRVMQQQMQAQTMQLRKRSQESLQKIQMQQMQDFIGELQPIILKLSAEGNFTVVLDRTRSNVFYADPTTDITDAVVAELKKQ